MRTRRAAPRRPAAVIACLLACLLTGTAALAGCGTGQAGNETLSTVTIAAQPQLSVPVPSSAGTWAVVPMGTSGTNLFWELFLRPPGTARWALVTPPGVADNGGLVAAAGSGRSLTAGFRPSQHLTFSPLAVTANAGRSWSALPGVLPGELAAGPDALAAVPGGKLLALTTADGGTAYSSADGGGRWTELTAAPSLARLPAAQACGVSGLTAVTVNANGTPLAGAVCGRPGTAGIFRFTGSSWQPAGPALPPSLHAATVRVLRLTTTPAGTAAVLATSGSGGNYVVGARASAAPSGSPGQHWTLTAPLATGTAQVLTAGPGPGGEIYVLLRSTGAGRLEMCQTPGSLWACFPAVPSGTVTIVPGPAGQAEALAVHGSQLTVWAAAPGHHPWRAVQTIKVGIPYGSSG
jgi:hypothetical protein